MALAILVEAARALWKVASSFAVFAFSSFIAFFHVKRSACNLLLATCTAIADFFFNATTMALDLIFICFDCFFACRKSFFHFALSALTAPASTLAALCFVDANLAAAFFFHFLACFLAMAITRFSLCAC